MKTFNKIVRRNMLRLIFIFSVAFSALQPAVALQFAPPRASTRTFFVYLPLVHRGPQVTPYTIAIANDCSKNLNPPVPSPATFAYGVRQLSVGVVVSGGVNLPYKMEWRINDKAQTGLTDSGTLYLSPETVGTTLIYSRFGLGCESALPAGVYESSFFLNGLLAQEMKVTISPATALAATDNTFVEGEESEFHLEVRENSLP